MRTRARSPARGDFAQLRLSRDDSSSAATLEATGESGGVIRRRDRCRHQGRDTDLWFCLRDRHPDSPHARADLVITQGICDVCAVPESQVVAASVGCEILTIDAHDLAAIFDSILAIGCATG